MTETMELGQRVAWTLVSYGKTDGLSEAHRVKDLDGQEHEYDGHTYCGELIPLEKRRLVFAYRSLPVCLRCETAHAQDRSLSVRKSA